MVYVPTAWTDGVTDVNAANMNKIEAELVALDSAPPAGIAYKGDWAAGTYQDGDVVVKDGVSFLCAGGPTTVAPDASLWGGVGVPAPVNGKWLKGAGGAMVWADPAALTTTPVITAANTDLAHPDPTVAVAAIRLNGSGGSLRTIGAPLAAGSRLEIQNWSGFPPFTILHGGAGAGASINIDGGASVVCPGGATAHFTYLGGSGWQLTGITLSRGSVGYGTSLPASPADGQEFILTNSLSAPNYSWHFRYAANHVADAYKWHFIGGAPAYVQVSAQETSTSTGYVNLATVQSITVPRDGAYVHHFDCLAKNVNASLPTWAMLTNTGGGYWEAAATVPANNTFGACAMTAVTAIAAGNALAVLFKVDGGTGGWQYRYMSVLPLRVA